MTTLPYNGRVHLIVGDLAHLILIYGQSTVREALDAHEMSPHNYHTTTLREHCQQAEDKQQ